MALFASSVSRLRVATKLETSRSAKSSQRVARNVQLCRALNSFTEFQITSTCSHDCKWHQTYTRIFFLWHANGKWIAATRARGILRLREDGLQMCRVAVNILNKQPCTANEVTTIPHPKTLRRYEIKELLWLKIRTSSERLWMREWTFGFHNMQEMSWLAPDMWASQEGICSMSWTSESVNQLVGYLVARTVFTQLNTKTHYKLGAVSPNIGYYKTTKIVCHVTSTVNRPVIILHSTILCLLCYTIPYHTVIFSTLKNKSQPSQKPSIANYVYSVLITAVV